MEASFHEGQTGDSIEGMKHEAAEADWIDGRFVGLLKCHACSGVIGMAGRYRVEEALVYDHEGQTTAVYTTVYRPTYFTDAPHIITVPDGTPDTVRERVIASFQQFWCDPEGCANHIRSAIEAVLTAKRIPKTAGTIRAPKSRGKRLSLHERIKLFEAVNPDLAAHLMAIKWIGNAGSHAARVLVDDLFDGYELLAVCLEELFGATGRRVRALSKSINRRRAPRSRRRGRR